MVRARPLSQTRAQTCVTSGQSQDPSIYLCLREQCGMRTSAGRSTHLKPGMLLASILGYLAAKHAVEWAWEWVVEQRQRPLLLPTVMAANWLLIMHTSEKIPIK